MTRFSKHVLAVALFAFWFVVAAGAQSTSVQRGSRVISGVVLSGASGQPLAKADVNIRDTQSQKLVAATTTGDDGGFAFDGLSDGRYVLTASHRGYLTSAYQEHDGGISTAIVTGEGLDTTNLRLTLQSDAAIYGTVTEDSGDPVPRARINLYARNRGTGRMRRAKAVTADAMGNFDLPHLAPGAYYLCASGMPWYAGSEPGTSPPGARIPAALDMAYRTACYPDGADPSAAEQIVVNPGDSLPLDLLLHPLPAVHISIQIPNACGGHGNTFPQLHEETFGIPEMLPAGFMIDCSRSPQDGGSTGTAYSFGMAPGQYEVELNSARQGGSQGSVHATTIDASSGELALDSSSFAAVPSLSGTVTVASGNTPTGIFLQPVGGQADGDQLYALVSPDGSFHFNSAPAGKYEVELAGDRDGRLVVDRIAAQGATAQGRTIEIGNTAAKLSITTVLANASVLGKVRSGSKPAGDIFLLMVPASAAAGRDAWRSNQSDSDGSFEFRNVAPGHYILVAIEEGWNLNWEGPGVIDPYLERGVSVSIKSSSARIVLETPLEAQPQIPLSKPAH